MRKSRLIALLLAASCTGAFAVSNKWDWSEYPLSVDDAGVFGNQPLYQATKINTLGGDLGFLELLHHTNATITLTSSFGGFIKIKTEGDNDSDPILVTLNAQRQTVTGSEPGGQDGDVNYDSGTVPLVFDINASSTGIVHGGTFNAKAAGDEGIIASNLKLLQLNGVSATGKNGLNISDIETTVIDHAAAGSFTGRDGATVAKAKKDDGKKAKGDPNGGIGVHFNAKAAHTLIATNLVATGGNGGKSSTTALGGTALLAKKGSVYLDNGTIRGGNGGEANSSKQTTADSSGGTGITVQEVTAAENYLVISNMHGGVYGGNGGEANSNGSSPATANGGDGLSLANSSYTVSPSNSLSGAYVDGNFFGGNGGAARAGGVASSESTATTNAMASAQGGHAVSLNETELVTFVNGSYTGGNGGNALSANSHETSGELADGGDAVHLKNSAAVFNGGTFSGGNGGTTSTNNSSANAGSGVYAAESVITFNGGTFSGGKSGKANTASQGYSVHTIDSDVTFNGGTFSDNVMIEASGGTNSMTTIAGGSFRALYLAGNGTNLVAFKNGNASFSDAVVQLEGITDILSWEESPLNIRVDGGLMNFNGGVLGITNGTRLAIGTDGTMAFNSGAIAGPGGMLDVGTGRALMNGDFSITSNGTTIVSFDERIGAIGLIEVASGHNFTIASNANLIVDGYVKTRSNSVVIATADNLDDVDENAISAKLGWLVQAEIFKDGNKLGANLSDRKIKDATTDGLIHDDILDAFQDSMTDETFEAMNNAGRSDTESALKMTYGQIPDSINIVTRNNDDLTKQITARGTDFRSSESLASTAPKFKPYEAPTGPAGTMNKAKDLKAWMRGYGNISTREEDRNFDEYDATSYGAVIGIDKKFDNVLIGLAGGYNRAGVDSSEAYELDIETVHGTIYSTIGLEKMFFDMALTYGFSTSEAETLLAEEKYGSDLYSGYIGGGYSIYLSEKFSLTPEVAFQGSYYDQEGFDQEAKTGAPVGSVEDYDAWSYMSIVGLSLAYLQGFDIYEHELAVLPEIRAKWLHEFNADLDDFTYGFNGTDYTFGVRPRDEDLLDLGFGLEMWSWNSEHTKVQLDYDLLISDSYQAHNISAKLSHEF